MLTVAEAARVLWGLGRLFRLDPKAFQAFPPLPAEAARSFQAAVLLLPLAAGLVILDHVTGNPTLRAVPLAGLLLVKGIAYVIGWTLFPVVMEVVSRVLNRRVLWPAWLAAYNWLQVPFLLIQTPIILADTLVGLPNDAHAFFTLLLLLAYSVLLGFTAHKGLRIPLGSAVSIVLIDLLLGMVLGRWSDSILDAMAGPVAGLVQ